MAQTADFADEEDKPEQTCDEQPNAPFKRQKDSGANYHAHDQPHQDSQQKFRHAAILQFWGIVSSMIDSAIHAQNRLTGETRLSVGSDPIQWGRSPSTILSTTLLQSIASSSILRMGYI